MKCFRPDPFHYFSRHTEAVGQPFAEEIGQVYIELSTFCNFACEACMRNEISGFRPEHFSLESVDRLVPMLKKLPRLERIVLLGFGESMCHPDFNLILKKLRAVDVCVVLVSNLSLFDESTLQLVSDLPLEEIWGSWDDPIKGDGISIRKGSEEVRFRHTVELIVSSRNTYNRIKKVGLEIVASKMNLPVLPQIFSYAASVGIDACIVTNIFPYSRSMQDQILYRLSDKSKTPDLKKTVPSAARSLKIKFPDMIADRGRFCPFIAKGTIFITAAGDVAPCPELAYTHPAYYFRSKRMHHRKIFGSMESFCLNRIWSDQNFYEFRERFKYFDFADCATCVDPDMCYHRTVKGVDCFDYDTPCGECLWAKNIVLCP